VPRCGASVTLSAARAAAPAWHGCCAMRRIRPGASTRSGAERIRRHAVARFAALCPPATGRPALPRRRLVPAAPGATRRGRSRHGHRRAARTGHRDPMAARPGSRHVAAEAFARRARAHAVPVPGLDVQGRRAARGDESEPPDHCPASPFFCRWPRCFATLCTAAPTGLAATRGATCAAPLRPYTRRACLP